MSDPTYPRIIATSRFTIGQRGYQGVVQIVHEPGNLRTIETVRECEHRHRTMTAARQCADGLAGRRVR